MELVAGPLAQDPAMMVEDPGTRQMVSLVDPTRRYYYGNSQGAIKGGAYTAIAPYFDRAVLGVEVARTMLLTRSRDFDPFFLVFKTMYLDPRHIALWLGLIHRLGQRRGLRVLERHDRRPRTRQYAHTRAPAGIGDAQVTTLGAQIIARGHGASLVGTPVRRLRAGDRQRSPRRPRARRVGLRPRGPHHQYASPGHRPP